MESSENFVVGELRLSVPEEKEGASGSARTSERGMEQDAYLSKRVPEAWSIEEKRSVTVSKGSKGRRVEKEMSSRLLGSRSPPTKTGRLGYPIRRTANGGEKRVN